MVALARLSFVVAATFALSAYQLPSHKDRMFAYPAIVDGSGDDITVDYRKERDIYGRDAQPRRKVKSRYISRGVRWSRKRRSYRSLSGKTLNMFTVGKARQPRISVVYLHGRGGSRRQGINDWIFGGNFNRLQNLMVKGRGRLYTPDFSGFGEDGADDIAGLVAKIDRETPNTRLVIACGSMGSKQCWRLARDPRTRGIIDGMVILGGRWDEKAVGKASFPVVFGHGSLDETYPVSRQKAFAKTLAKNGQPVRFVTFRSGVHGTPIRMIDWRTELNWILSQK